MAAPHYDETTALASITAALDFAASAQSRHRRAQRLFQQEFLRAGRRLIKRTDPFTAQLHWAIWFMSQRLFEHSVFDPSRRCSGACETPAECSSLKDPERTSCLRSLSFPFLHSEADASGKQTYKGWNIHKAARAIARGLSQVHNVSHTPEEAAIRQVIKRFSKEIFDLAD